MNECIKWNVPEGWEIDKEKSNDKQIVFKKIEDSRAYSWQQYCEKMRDKDSYYFDKDAGDIWKSKFEDEPALTEFADTEYIKPLIAFVKLLKLRKDWVGSWQPDWMSEDPKHIILIEKNNIEDSVNYNISNPLSFPTQEMRDEFMDCFKDLLEQAKPLL